MPASSAQLTHLRRDVKFGRIPATPEMRAKALPLGHYLKLYGGTPPPAKVDWYTKARASLGTMLGNDQVGNCVVVAAMHGVGAWSAHEPGGAERMPSEQEAMSEYRSICGPGDNGCYIPRVLDAFRDRGLSVGRAKRKIDGYVSVNPRDELLVKVAVHLFGGLHLGINWPRDWMSGAKPGGVLQPTSSPIIGGHAVQGVGYDDVGLVISTWGILCHLSWAALASPRFVDECYALLGEDWYDDHGATAAGAGVNVAKLREDLRVIAGGGTPEIPPEPAPTPPPPPPPVPGPVGPLELRGTLDFFGHALPLTLAQVVPSAGTSSTVAWPKVYAELVALIQHAQAHEYCRVSADALALFGALGHEIGPTELTALLKALDVLRETAPLALPSPPPGY